MNDDKAWETVTKWPSGKLAVERMRVPGGWLYRDYTTNTTVFVPGKSEPVVGEGIG